MSKNKKGCAVIFCVFAMLFCMALDSDWGAVTYDNFQMINAGDSYFAVTTRFQCLGHLLAEYNVGKNKFQVYQWKAFPMARATITFENSRVVSKSQNWLH